MTFCCSAFIASSQDGCIARQDSAIDWRERTNETVTPGKDCGYATFMRTVGQLRLDQCKGRTSSSAHSTSMKAATSASSTRQAAGRLNTGSSNRAP